MTWNCRSCFTLTATKVKQELSRLHVYAIWPLVHCAPSDQTLQYTELSQLFALKGCVLLGQLHALLIVSRASVAGDLDSQTSEQAKFTPIKLSYLQKRFLMSRFV
jgi:hypothetical protein